MFATVTPTITTSAYSANDQVGGIQVLSFGEGVKCIKSVTVVDAGKQSAALKILLFEELPVVASSDNAAANIVDAEVTAKCFGSISIAAADYIALAASSVATVAVDIAAQSRGGKIWAVALTTGTPTYASISDLTFKYGAT